uniref:Putative secreted protein n=1 Tax=Anopheles darlingi TaxID=43151 RepID=A0A2M4DRF3_ANODA
MKPVQRLLALCCCSHRCTVCREAHCSSTGCCQLRLLVRCVHSGNGLAFLVPGSIRRTASTCHDSPDEERL